MDGLMSAGPERREGLELMLFGAGMFWQSQLVALLHRHPKWWQWLPVYVKDSGRGIEAFLEGHVRQRLRSEPVDCSAPLLPSAFDAFDAEQASDRFCWAFSKLESEVLKWRRVR